MLACLLACVLAGWLVGRVGGWLVGWLDGLLVGLAGWFGRVGVSVWGSCFVPGPVRETNTILITDKRPRVQELVYILSPNIKHKCIIPLLVQSVFLRKARHARILLPVRAH